MKILVADDHSLFREGIRQLFYKIDSDAYIYEAASHQQTFDIIQLNTDIDIVLLDLSMPGGNGLTALANILGKYPMLPVVVLSASESAEEMKSVLKMGAMGFIGKGESKSVIYNAIKLILSGGVYVPPVLIKGSHESSEPNSSIDLNLSPRQIEVIKCVIGGKSNKEIASELNLSEATVKSHLREAFKIMNVKSRTQAAMKADKLGV